MKNLLGINTDCIKDGLKIYPESETLKIIKDVGFECFFSSLFTEKEVEELKNVGDKLGLEFSFIHAPFKGINALWEQGDGYEFIYNNIITTINSASKNGVNTIVMHGSSTWRPPKISEVGLSRFDKLIDYAQKKDVNVAFENLRVKEYLDVVLKRYETVKNVGFCYDFGHESCFDSDKNLYLPEYGNRLMVTHIHDNFGRTIIDDTIKDDKHFIPLDGNIDYKVIFEKLRELDYFGALTLELSNNAKLDYQKMSHQEFISLAFKRLNKIISL